MFSLEKRHLRGKLIECFKILNGFTNVDKSKLFVIDDTLRTRNNGIKLKCRQVNSDCTTFFFTNVVVREWNKLLPSLIIIIIIIVLFLTFHLYLREKFKVTPLFSKHCISTSVNINFKEVTVELVFKGVNRVTLDH